MQTQKVYTYAELNDLLEDMNLFEEINTQSKPVQTVLNDFDDGFVSPEIFTKIKAFHTNKSEIKNKLVDANLQIKEIDHSISTWNDMIILNLTLFTSASILPIYIAVTAYWGFSFLAILLLSASFDCLINQLEEKSLLNKEKKSQEQIVSECQTQLGLFSNNKQNTTNVEAQNNQLIII